MKNILKALNSLELVENSTYQFPWLCKIKYHPHLGREGMHSPPAPQKNHYHRYGFKDRNGMQIDR